MNLPSPGLITDGYNLGSGSRGCSRERVPDAEADRLAVEQATRSSSSIYSTTFWSEEAAATAPELPDRVGTLLADARADGLRVVHVRARFRPDGGDWMARYRLRGWIPCIDGTPGVETLPFASELPGEPVVTKHSFDGFLGTNLDEVLAGQASAACSSPAWLPPPCVLFTASTATQRGISCQSCRTVLGPRGPARTRLSRRPIRVRHGAMDEIAERSTAWDADLDGSPPCRDAEPDYGSHAGPRAGRKCPRIAGNNPAAGVRDRRLSGAGRAVPVSGCLL